MISRYMVLVASEQKLLMMRPYQIYAVKHIVDCIDKNSGNGYVWHTTGSGKTLTSFKASTLLKDNPAIESASSWWTARTSTARREEFNRFQEGCVEENTNTDTLVRRLLSDDYADKVIVCTIQKLGLALDPSNKRNYIREAEATTRQADGLHLRRVPPLAIRREPQGHQGVLPQGPALRLYRHADLRGERHRQQINGDRQLSTTKDLFQRRCTSTRSPMLSRTQRPALSRRLFKPEGRTCP